jgi:hypothetical protein
MSDSKLVAFEERLDPDRRAILLEESLELIDLKIYLKNMLLSSETLLEIWSVKPHELAQSLESDAVAHVFHPLLIGNDVVVEGFEARNFRHQEVTIPRRLNHWVIEESQVVKRLYCCQRLKISPFLHAIVVKEK